MARPWPSSHTARCPSRTYGRPGLDGRDEVVSLLEVVVGVEEDEVDGGRVGRLAGEQSKDRYSARRFTAKTRTSDGAIAF
ncbi:hypothetical protein HYQ46_003007 [Verticillium longisporum]|nr:hypothetical protein HYQ46_003007 [Verticillium longisporum]